MRGKSDQTVERFVSLLTIQRRTSRKSGGKSGGYRPAAGPMYGPICDRFRLLRGIAMALLLCISSSILASNWQSNDAISETAEEFVRDHYGKTDPRFAPKAAALDPRLRLHQCSGALQAFVRDGTKVGNRAIVGVRCHGPKPWKVYVPVEIVVMESVLIARKTLPKGHLPTESDVRIEQRDISRMNGGYLSDVAELDGQRLKHQVIGGRAMTPSMLKAEIVIHRGQSVTLIVRNDQMSISMAGKALADRARNQRIRVENLGSGRIVEGIVRSAEVVEVLVR